LITFIRIAFEEEEIVPYSPSSLAVLSPAAAREDTLLEITTLSFSPSFNRFNTLSTVGPSTIVLEPHSSWRKRTKLSASPSFKPDTSDTLYLLLTPGFSVAILRWCIFSATIALVTPGWEIMRYSCEGHVLRNSLVVASTDEEDCSCNLDAEWRESGRLLVEFALASVLESSRHVALKSIAMVMAIGSGRDAYRDVENIKNGLVSLKATTEGARLAATATAATERRMAGLMSVCCVVVDA
jgi:hypothetical protein